MSQAPAHHKVLIAGGGVAGLEAMLALSSMAGERATISLASPSPSFRVRALSVAEPFGAPRPINYSVVTACLEHGVKFLGLALDRVNHERGTATLSDGTVREYDSLLVAVGARIARPYSGGVLFRGREDSPAFEDLLAGMERGLVRRVAFVVPTGVSWPLPLYELALMLARRGGPTVEVIVITPEGSPLAVAGPVASRAVASELAEVGIVVMPECSVTEIHSGRVVVSGLPEPLSFDQVVTIPRLEGPWMPGLPADEHGFITVDGQGRVVGAENVWAAGDGTSFPVKQGGLGAQMAAAAAGAIAAAAGVSDSPADFSPVLRAQLLTGAEPLWLQVGLDGDGGAAEGATGKGPAPWTPAMKVSAPYLAAHLGKVDAELEAADDDLDSH